MFSIKLFAAFAMIAMLGVAFSGAFVEIDAAAKIEDPTWELKTVEDKAVLVYTVFDMDNISDIIDGLVDAGFIDDKLSAVTFFGEFEFKVIDSSKPKKEWEYYSVEDLPKRFASYVKEDGTFAIPGDEFQDFVNKYVDTKAVGTVGDAGYKAAKTDGYVEADTLELNKVTFDIELTVNGMITQADVDKAVAEAVAKAQPSNGDATLYQCLTAVLGIIVVAFGVIIFLALKKAKAAGTRLL